jgi:hypothetical protein
MPSRLIVSSGEPWKGYRIDRLSDGAVHSSTGETTTMKKHVKARTIYFVDNKPIIVREWMICDVEGVRQDYEAQKKSVKLEECHSA